VQLQREAAVVLALGGGFEAYYKQKRDGSISPSRCPVMAEVAKFCRARQAVCHHAEAVPQVALLYSTAAHYRKVNGLFFPRRRPPQRQYCRRCWKASSRSRSWARPPRGPAGGVSAHRGARVEYLEAAVYQDPHRLRESGRQPAACGPKTAALFAAELGITLTGEAKPNGPLYLAHDGPPAAIKGAAQAAVLSPQARPFGRLHQPRTRRRPRSRRPPSRGSAAAALPPPTSLSARLSQRPHRNARRCS